MAKLRVVPRVVRLPDDGKVADAGPAEVRERGAAGTTALVGEFVRVRSKSNPNRHWWVTVIERRGRYVKVKGGTASGKAWWTTVESESGTRSIKYEQS